MRKYTGSEKTDAAHIRAYEYVANALQAIFGLTTFFPRA